MADQKSEVDFLQPPDDVEMLYNWANLYGAKYRDFSASRQRLRAQREGLPLDQVVSAEHAGPKDVESHRQSERAAPLVDSSSATVAVANRSAAPNSPVEQTTASAGTTQEPLSAPGQAGSRWYALKNVLGHASGIPNLFRRHDRDGQPQILAVFSLCGGVGKTSLVAALGRALSQQGESNLLVDTAPYGLLPFYFGACEQRPGAMRTFTPPANASGNSVRVISMSTEDFSAEDKSGKELLARFTRLVPDADRILVDVATASSVVTNRLLALSPSILVPLVPDMSSVATLGAVEFFFHRHKGSHGEEIRPYYILNQFDESISLHRDIREALRKQLGDRLLPFCMHRGMEISEALAEGMTVVDYAQQSQPAQDIRFLSQWLSETAPLQRLGHQAVRWSEQE